MKSARVIGLAAVSIQLFAAGVAQASYPAGVWVKAQGVQLEPSPDAPTHIRIHGVAMLYDGSNHTSYVGYTEPARGVLYYECPASQLATCRDEWNDIVRNIDAPLEVCVGLGDLKQPTGRLRRPDEPLGTADVYPIHMGILPGYSPCQRIREFLSGEIDAGTGVGGTTGAGGSSGGSGGAGGTQGVAGTGASGSAGSTSGPAGSGGSTGGTSSGNAGASASTPENSAREERGCSLSRARSSSAYGLVLVALAALALRRRRRG